MRFEKHIFICSNQKAEGKKCCGENHGLELVNKFREVLLAKGLKGKVRAQRSGCLDACGFGPSIVIYPEGTYYGSVQISDVEKIIDQHVLQNKIVEELEIKFTR